MGGATIIDLSQYKKWTDVIDKIASCQFIISYSLHGLIISDAYKIPNIWVNHSGFKPIGGSFKFKDYYLAVRPNLKEEEINPVQINEDINFDDLKEYFSHWSPINFDIKPLINACPFKLNISINETD